MQQITNSILMIRPRNPRANEQTAANNHFQNHTPIEDAEEKVQLEFDRYVKKLRAVGVNVIVYEQDDQLDTPDAHFPNNWLSTHENGDIVLYPMYAKNRRLERREGVLKLLESSGFSIENIIDYSIAENESVYLEGTGSLVLDRQNKIAFCALSDRSDEGLFIEFCEDFEYNPIVFTANQIVKGNRKPIYHTNVMMCIAETFAIVCLDSIDNKKERKQVATFLKSSGKEIIKINEKQVTHFAGNMLQVVGRDEKRYLVMSEAAFNALTQSQISTIEKHCDILYSAINTIEAYAGGSVRCLITEVFLPQQGH